MIFAKYSSLNGISTFFVPLSIIVFIKSEMGLDVTMAKKDRLHRQGIIEKGSSLAVTPVNPQYFTSKVQAFLQSQGVQVRTCWLTYFGKF